MKKKKTMALFLAPILLMGILLPGCGQGQTTVQESAIGSIGAMDEEVATLKEAAKITKTTTIAGMEFCEGKLGDNRVVIVQCGIGKVNAGICAHALINDFGCAKIVNTGVAGALDNQLDIGDRTQQYRGRAKCEGARARNAARTRRFCRIDKPPCMFLVQLDVGNS